jgi:hypothetical protein
MDESGRVDLHFHSVYSDGSEEIPAIIEEAKKRDVVALALTDHNNGAGVPKFMAACKEAGILSLEGTEIYASFPETEWSWNPDFCGPVPDVIILGRKLNWQELEKYQELLREYRFEYWLPETLKGLAKAGLKVPNLTKDEMREQIANLGLPRILHDVPNNPDNLDSLWNVCLFYEPEVAKEEVEKSPVRWANKHLYAIGKLAYALRAPEEWTLRKAVELAKAMGGVLFAAHPGGEYGNWSDEHLDFFVNQGGEGIEVYQYWHSSLQMEKFSKFAKKHDLLVSGGSDWHGKNGKATLGCWDKPSVQTPFEVFEQLLDRLP